MKSFILIILFALSLNVFAYPQLSDFKDDYEISDISYTLLERDSDYIRRSGELKLLEKSKELTCEFFFYESLNPLNRLIVLTPTIDGVSALENRLAHRLAKEGFHVLVPIARDEGFPVSTQSAQNINITQQRAMMASIAMIEGLKESYDFNDQYMGVAGASMGGIRSSMLYGLDDRFKAAFISVAGGDFPSLYAKTTNDSLTVFRRDHMQALDMNDLESYENHLRAILTFDPMMISQSPHLEGIAMIIADDDTTVPSVNQWKLWSAVKEQGVHPRTIQRDVGHVVGVLKLILYESTFVDWFKKKLL